MKQLIFAIIIIFLFVYFFINHKKRHTMPLYALVQNNRMIQDNFESYKGTSNYKIIVSTLETRDLKCLDLHNKTVQYWCDKHGYTYDFRNKYNNELKLPIYWQKLQLIQDILNSDCEYVLWLDSDTIICHPEIPLEYVIDKNKDVSIFINKDYPCSKNEPYCAGVFMIKNDHFGKSFINDCIETYTNNEKCKTNGEMSLNGAYAGECYEQGVMNVLLKTKYKNNMLQISNDFVMNTVYPCYGTVILHFYDRDKDYGYQVFKKYYDNFVELIPNYKIDRKMNIGILLTMYTSDEKRAKMYSKNLKKWSKSGFEIYSVESNDYKYNVPDVNQFVFKQDDLQYAKSKGPSIKEKESILRAYNYFGDRLMMYNFIFKVTGKYYLENLQQMLQYIPSDAEIIVQNQANTWGQNSEIIGAKPHILFDIVNQIDEQTAFEEVLKEVIKSKKYKIYRFLPLKFNDKVQRSDGSYLEFL